MAYSNEQYFYYVYKGDEVVYREYRLQKALDWFNSNECDKLYLYTKDLFPKKVLAYWK